MWCQECSWCVSIPPRRLNVSPQQRTQPALAWGPGSWVCKFQSPSRLHCSVTAAGEASTTFLEMPSILGPDTRDLHGWAWRHLSDLHSGPTSLGLEGELEMVSWDSNSEKLEEGSWASQVVPMVKNLPANAGDIRDSGSIPGSERCPGGHGNPLQYSCLENPHGQRRLAGYSPEGHKESDTTDAT